LDFFLKVNPNIDFLQPFRKDLNAPVAIQGLVIIRTIKENERIKGKKNDLWSSQENQADVQLFTEIFDFFQNDA